MKKPRRKRACVNCGHLAGAHDQRHAGGACFYLNGNEACSCCNYRERSAQKTPIPSSTTEGVK